MSAHPELVFATPVVVVLTQNTTVFPLGFTAGSGEPLFLVDMNLTINERSAGDLAMTVTGTQYDTQGTSGTDTDGVYLDSRITATPPDGQYNMTGSSTAIPNASPVVLLPPFHIGTSEKLFNFDLRGIVVPAGKVFAISIANPSGNTSPNCLLSIRASRSPV